MGDELSAESLNILRDLVERFDTMIQRRRLKLQRPQLYATDKACIDRARTLLSDIRSRGADTKGGQ